MQKKTLDPKYIALLTLTILYCAGSIIYCIAHGQQMALTRTEPQYTWFFTQTFAATILWLILICIKRIRKKWYWRIIPVLLIGTAFSYPAIVAQFPCYPPIV